ncbi:hypothetical protein ml_315 [Mollivirus sibericum]|uniref:hypothetical protein n=1 Tax=Mollivirus sibericum TaxID=1678078 RepID=UPI0006B2DD9C|nr:hypothetical protein ml_315 [Mollivirus sibericum]ALD62117.1 hypothetical protein ml_315 [Mollivirus sibericum]
MAAQFSGQILSAQVRAYEELISDGPADIAGQLSVGGDIIAYENVDIQGSLSIAGGFDVQGGFTADEISATGPLEALGGANIQGGLATDSLTSAGLVSSAAGFTSLAGPNSFAGSTTFADGVTIQGPLQANGGIDLGTGDFNIEGNLTAQGITGDFINVSAGPNTIAGNTALEGPVTVTGLLTAQSDVIVSGVLSAQGGIELGGPVSFDGPLQANGGLTVVGGLSTDTLQVTSGLVSFQAGLEVAGGADIDTLAVSGEVVTQNLEVAGASVLAGATTLGGVATFGNSPDFGGFVLRNVADPVNPTDAVNLETLDTAIAGATGSRSVVDLVSTAALPVSGSIAVTPTTLPITTAIVDGETLVAGQRLLVTGQAVPSQNGIYEVTEVDAVAGTALLTRPAGATTPAGLASNYQVLVTGGTQAGSLYLLSLPFPTIVDSTSVAPGAAINYVLGTSPYQPGAAQAEIIDLSSGTGVIDGAYAAHILTNAPAAGAIVTLLPNFAALPAGQMQTIAAADNAGTISFDIGSGTYLDAVGNQFTGTVLYFTTGRSLIFLTLGGGNIMQANAGALSAPPPPGPVLLEAKKIEDIKKARDVKNL